MFFSRFVFGRFTVYNPFKGVCVFVKANAANALVPMFFGVSANAVFIGSMGNGSVGYFAACILAFMPMTVFVGEPLSRKIVIERGFYLIAADGAVYRGGAVAVVRADVRFFGVNRFAACVLAFMPMPVFVGEPLSPKNRD